MNIADTAHQWMSSWIKFQNSPELGTFGFACSVCKRSFSFHEGTSANIILAVWKAFTEDHAGCKPPVP